MTKPRSRDRRRSLAARDRRRRRRLADARQGRARRPTACRARSWRSSTRCSPTLARGAAEGADRHLRASSGFIAGADIKEFVGIRTPDAGVRADSPGPAGARPARSAAAARRSPPSTASRSAAASRSRSPAAIACCVDDPAATLGFPEVQLGVHPGFGGTVRAVQLAGPIAAMDLMLTGRIDPPETGARDGPRRPPRAASRSSTRRRKQVALAPPPARSADARASPAQLWRWCVRSSPGRCARRSRGARGPSTTLPRTRSSSCGSATAATGERAYEAEARSMAQLLCTPTSRNLVRVFFLQDRLKSAGKAGGEPAKHVHVVGAGVMGGDIASLVRGARPHRHAAGSRR